MFAPYETLPTICVYIVTVGPDDNRVFIRTPGLEDIHFRRRSARSWSFARTSAVHICSPERPPSACSANSRFTASRRAWPLVLHDQLTRFLSLQNKKKWKKSYAHLFPPRHYWALWRMSESCFLEQLHKKAGHTNIFDITFSSRFYIFYLLRFFLSWGVGTETAGALFQQREGLTS